MAGYMTKLQGYVYEGEYVNGAAAAVQNGTIMTLSSDKKKLALAATPSGEKPFVCKEKTTIFDGIEAYRMLVVAAPSVPLFFVENNAEINDSAEYDISTYSTAVGELVRAHVLLPGDEFLVSATGLTVGTAYGVNASGAIA